ncbi:hypothetical protein O181_020989 [Austropuccinia psidii MF-1]|uniref:Uncharacterized protein n=1 Tax=Austropuccinia psidii MF-1 TaxID=1389203 RepID=A0A9Q3C9Y5_9BASI|nr:hypothetical protein [Austropuccinia psidii MF-1]
MLIQHEPPTRHTRPQARAQSVQTPIPRAPLDGTPVVPQLRAHLDSISRTTLKGLGEYDSEAGENSVEEEEFDGTEASPVPMGEPQGTGGKTIAQYNNPVSHQYKQSLLVIMQ